ncbi:universal stress protein [Phocicoccus schoeneichii]|uniref:universal stress protein n=1 Tax=Phocicoccus schoeneichii TaxID=1812261 RepID=UPI00163F08D6|nr:universal stress protein [Jeotgalicoccus schoeneichii]
MIRKLGDIIYNHLLVAVEESEYSLRAAQEVLNLVDDHTEVSLIHVIDPNRMEEDILPSVINEIKYNQFEEKYKEIKEFYQTNQIHHTLEVKEGNIADLILEEANSGKYDAIVIGAMGKKKFLKLEFGHVSDKILKESSIPVILVK